MGSFRLLETELGESRHRMAIMEDGPAALPDIYDLTII